MSILSFSRVRRVLFNLFLDFIINLFFVCLLLLIFVYLLVFVFLTFVIFEFKFGDFYAESLVMLTVAAVAKCGYSNSGVPSRSLGHASLIF